jgi:Spy/CpxP family protein refolding chaperone
MVDRVFSRVEASDDQKARITSIATDAYRDLAPLRGQFRSARSQALELLTAEQIDAAAVESLRSDQVKLLDQASNRATSAMTEIAQVLTPEQRAQVREKLAARMEKRRGWRRWHHGS